MWKELKKRWKSESPKFWKKVMQNAVILGSSAASLIVANTTFGLVELGLPMALFTVSGYVVAFCAAMGISAKLTVVDKNV